LIGLPHNSELYLAWCLIGDSALLNQNFEDAKAAYEVARQIDPTAGRAMLGLAAAALDTSEMDGARELGLAASALFDRAGDREVANLLSCAQFWTDQRTPIKGVAAIVFAHVTEKLRVNVHLGAPTVGLVSEAVTSFRHRLQVGPEVPITIFYDHRNTPLNRLSRGIGVQN
jgi:hypothetical protein